MKKLGHIKITEKVKFVYHELEKPDTLVYEQTKDFYFDNAYYKEVIKAYEASKKTVEVSNYNQINRLFLKTAHIDINKHLKTISDNQPCEAEVTDKALITKLL